MAQTTQNASFGPILVNTAHPNPSRCVKLDIEPKVY